MGEWDRIKAVFLLASAVSGTERAALLDRECAGDAGLRREVESLLNAQGELRTGDGIRAVETIAGPLLDTPLREGPGTKIGPYKLLQQIGEGGFGVVFLAEQEKPVQRRVALKIIKLGMDTHQVVARFEQERQALAMMDHPNIAKVLDAGATDTGRPYFVMELVRGDPITNYCDTHNLSVEERLGLFQQVCHAVQHAHQKGIIHRDIKPSNVLVTVADGKPIPKVIDFGIAKATISRLTEKTLFTEHRQLIGTPEYMSPEQAEMTGVDIDTRSDIYSLGVLLYELLTGVLPFDSQRLRSAAFGEIQRIIREEDPPNPSTRLSTLGTLANVASHRHTEPARLTRLVRGDLDWIVMKALEKDRTRRYETANGLASDVERHLAGEPVLAAPPSSGYKLRKFVRKHRVGVAAGSAIGAALLLGIAGTTLGLLNARAQRDRALLAERSEAEQRARADERADAARKAEAAATVARDAEKARADELKQVSDFQEKMLAQLDSTTAGVRLTEDVNRRFAAALAKAGVPQAELASLANAFRQNWIKVNATDVATALIDETILKPAVKTIDEQFKDQATVDAQLRQALATLYRSIGLYDAAFPLQESALVTRRRVLGSTHPDTLNSLGEMGALLQESGKLEAAEPVLLETLSMRRGALGEDHPDTIASIANLGSLRQAQGRLSEAEAYTREAMNKFRRVLGEDHIDTLSAIHNMGSVLCDQRKLDEAEPYYREALEKRRRVLGDDHRNTLESIGGLGGLLAQQGKRKEAEPYFEEVLEKSRRFLGDEHPGTLGAINNMGALLHANGKLVEAEPYCREVVAKARRLLGEDHPNTLIAINGLGELLQKQGKLIEAELYFREVLERSRRTVGEDHPSTLDALRDMGVILAELGRLADAEPYVRELVQKRTRILGEDDPATLLAVKNMSGLLRDQGKLAAAEPYYREALARQRRVLGDDHPDTLGALNNLGTLLQAQDKLDEAEPFLREDYERSRRVLSPEDPHMVPAIQNLAFVLQARGKPDEAEPYFREALALSRRLFPNGDENTTYVLANLGALLEARGDRAGAKDMYRQSLAINRRLLPAGSPELSGVMASFGLFLLKTGTPQAAAEAEPLLRECLEIRRREFPDGHPQAFRKYNAMSLLGGAILGIAQDPTLATDARAARFREAEPLLLDGYAGLKDDPAVPAPDPTRALDFKRQSLERIICLYQTWETIEPCKGYQDKAAEWQKKLEPGP